MRHPALMPLALALLIGACQPLPPSGTTAASSQSAATTNARMLWGHASPTWQVQAVESELKPYGTLALLDTGNNVVATGTTDGSGNFSLNPFAAWTPTTNAVYVLELTKQFVTSNEGAMLRMRTLVSWTGTQWKSISGTTAQQSGGSGVLVNSGTTAIAAIQNLRALTASNMLGKLDPYSGVFTTTGTGIAAADFTTVQGLVTSSLAANLDPVRAISWSSVDSVYLAQLAPRNGHLVFDLKDTPPIAGTNPTPIRSKYGTGYAVSVQAGIYFNQFGSYGTAGGAFNQPMDLAMDQDGNVYVSNLSLNRVDKFDPNDRYLTSFGYLGSGNGQFNRITSVDVDPSGKILALDYANHRVQKLDPSGNFLMGIGQGMVWTTGAPPAVNLGTPNSWFSSPHYAKFDPYGNIWVADTCNYRMQVFSASGAFIRGIGNGGTWTDAGQLPAMGTGNAWFGGPSIAGPTGFAFDRQGNVWVCDRGNHRLQKFDGSGNFLAAYGSLGTGNGQLYTPESVTFDSSGNLWVSEYRNQRLQKFDPAFNYLGQISTAGATGSAPGTFYYPRGMLFDRNGYLLVADCINNRIQRFAPASSTLNFSSTGHFNLSAGTMEAWIRPSWSGTTPGVFRLLQVYTNPSGTGDGIGIYKSGSQISADLWPHATTGSHLTGDISNWTPYTDHHIAFTWDGTNRQTLYLDGKFVKTLVGTGSMQVQPSTIEVGSGGGWEQAEAVFESARFYDYAKSQAEISRDYALVEQY